MENLKKENETSRLRIEKLENGIISKTPKSDQARMKKTLGEIELDSKLSIRVRYLTPLTEIDIMRRTTLRIYNIEGVIQIIMILISVKGDITYYMHQNF